MDDKLWRDRSFRGPKKQSWECHWFFQTAVSPVLKEMPAAGHWGEGGVTPCVCVCVCVCVIREPVSLEGAQGWILALFSLVKSIIVFDLLIPLSTYRVVITISVEHKTYQKKFKQVFEAKRKDISSTGTMLLIVVHWLSRV